MSRHFAITTGSNTIEPGENRTGTVTFTVSNNTEEGITARARIFPLDDCREEWFTIEGEKERTYTEKTQQYTVRFSIPPSVPPGSYRFRLDVFGVENPDEIYSEGPVVEIRVKEKEEPPAGSPFPWWVIAVIAAVLIIGGGITWWALSRTSTVTVPDVVGETTQQARELLSQSNFTVEEKSVLTINDNDIDKVIRQDPPAGTEADKQSTVVIHIGKRGIQVPGILGKTIEQAIEILNNKGLAYHIFTDAQVKEKIALYKRSLTSSHISITKPTIPRVRRTNPPPDKIVDPDDPVSVYMGSGSAQNIRPLHKKDLEVIGLSSNVLRKMINTE
ncbi:MAG: PASTA domain-containing protein [Desulfobacteraceae bacterium]|nr:PASTA domain-containing protein [Desulfobacteraceae bacterium]